MPRQPKKDLALFAAFLDEVILRVRKLELSTRGGPIGRHLVAAFPNLRKYFASNSVQAVVRSEKKKILLFDPSKVAAKIIADNGFKLAQGQGGLGTAADDASHQHAFEVVGIDEKSITFFARANSSKSRVVNGTQAMPEVGVDAAAADPSTLTSTSTSTDV